MQKIFRIKNLQAGFTLIETLAAVSILMIAVAGPLTLANNSLRSSMTAKSELVASYLAQDAVEYLKVMRDASISKDGWIDRNLSSCDTGSECGIDTTVVISIDGSGNITSSGLQPACSSTNNNCELSFHGDTGFYNYVPAGAELSGFTRKLAAAVTASEVKVEVMVEWKQGRLNRSVILRSSLFNLK